MMYFSHCIGEFLKPSTSISGRGFCIVDNQVCDGVFDCQDHTDEMNCTNTCVQDEFRCSNGSDRRAGGRCVPLSYVCDRELDCSGKLLMS